MSTPRGVATRPYVCPIDLHMICAQADAGDLDPDTALAAFRGLLRGWTPSGPTLADLTPAPAATGEALTARELQILHGMADGRTNAQIGRSLHRSPDTIKRGARRIFVKLGARDRAQAVAVAYDIGLFSSQAQRETTPARGAA